MGIISTRAIRELRRLLDDSFAAKTAGDLDPKEFRRMMIEFLDEVGQSIREEGVPETFKDFLKSWSGLLFGEVLVVMPYLTRRHLEPILSLC